MEIRHSPEDVCPLPRTRPTRGTLVRQRLFQIACGYEDQNDAATLRHDPLLKAVCGRLPESGALAWRAY